MPQYIVLSLHAGTPIPAEGVPSSASFVLTTQATEAAAYQVAANIAKPDNGDKFWAIDTSALHQYIATRIYGGGLG